MGPKRAVTRADILAPADYALERERRRRDILSLKRQRRLAVGPFAIVHFENYDTMWQQIHEMLYIEKGGVRQIEDELGAYNPLIPQGHELVATVMFEVEDAVRRQDFLGRLGGVEHTAFIAVGGETIAGRPEADQERSTPEGKASSVQFIRFPFTPEQIARFRAPGAEVVVGFKHREYAHMTVMPEPVRRALSADFD